MPGVSWKARFFLILCAILDGTAVIDDTLDPARAEFGDSSAVISLAVMLGLTFAVADGISFMLYEGPQVYPRLPGWCQRRPHPNPERQRLVELEEGINENRKYALEQAKPEPSPTSRTRRYLRRTGISAYVALGVMKQFVETIYPAFNIYNWFRAFFEEGEGTFTNGMVDVPTPYLIGSIALFSLVILPNYLASEIQESVNNLTDEENLSPLRHVPGTRFVVKNMAPAVCAFMETSSQLVFLSPTTIRQLIKSRWGIGLLALDGISYLWNLRTQYRMQINFDQAIALQNLGVANTQSPDHIGKLSAANWFLVRNCERTLPFAQLIETKGDTIGTAIKIGLGAAAYSLPVYALLLSVQDSASVRETPVSSQAGSQETPSPQLVIMPNTGSPTARIDERQVSL